MFDLTQSNSVVRTVGVAVPMLALLASCSRDPLAPDCFVVENGESQCLTPFPGSSDVTADCTNFPQTAVGAEFSYDVSSIAEGGTGQFSDWSATNLPPGLSIDPDTGIISGVAEAPGNTSYPDIRISVVDQFSGEEFEFRCGEIVVNDALNAFAARGEERRCIPYDFTVDQWTGILQGGDGSEITCQPLATSALPCPLGDGNGRPPPGISFNESSCTHSGSINSSRFGTWVWMVEIEQSGYRTHVPFCAVNDVPTFHSIGQFVFGTPESPLLPGLLDYDPNGGMLNFGGGTHRWDIVDPACESDPTQCNSFGFRYDVTCSPFDPPFVVNGMSSSTGLEHEMTAMGPQPSASFDGRPWVASFEMSYCTNQSGAFCDVNDPNFDQNAQTEYHFDVIGYPILGGP